VGGLLARASLLALWHFARADVAAMGRHIEDRVYVSSCSVSQQCVQSYVLGFVSGSGTITKRQDKCLGPNTHKTNCAKRLTAQSNNAAMYKQEDMF
jgi:hypothetical protein